MKAVCSYSLRLWEDFNQKNKVRMVNYQITNFGVEMVISQRNKNLSP